MHKPGFWPRSWPELRPGPSTSACGAALLLAACAADHPAPAPARPLPPPPIGQVCTDFSFPIYFDTASDQLTAAARQVVADAASKVRGCVFGRIDVVGLSDADGAANRNLALSRRRAASVATALAAGGLPRPEFDIDAVGQAGAVTTGGDSEPLRRRTEVVIRASPPPAPAPAKPAANSAPAPGGSGQRP